VQDHVLCENSLPAHHDHCQTKTAHACIEEDGNGKLIAAECQQEAKRNEDSLKDLKCSPH
jgi:hypothetical protein